VPLRSAYWLSVAESEEAYPEWAELLFKEDLATWQSLTLGIFVTSCLIASIWGLAALDGFKGTQMVQVLDTWASKSTPIRLALRLALVCVAVVVGLSAGVSMMIVVGMLGLLGIVAIALIMKSAKKYTFQVQQTIEYVQGLSRLKKFAVAVVGGIGWIAVACGLGSFVKLESPNSLQDNVWVMVMSTVLLIFAAALFALVFLCMSVRKKTQ